MQEGVRGERTIDLHRWRDGNGIWTRSRNLEGMVIGLVYNQKREWNKDSKKKWGRSMIISWKLAQKGVSRSLRSKYVVGILLCLFFFPWSSFLECF